MRLLDELDRLHERGGVRRAWPGGDGSLTFETRDAAGRLRAGRLTDEGTTLAPFGVDRKLPGLSARAGDGDLLVHRLHKRAVVREGEVFTKVVRPGRAAGVLAASGAVAAACAGAGLAGAPVLGSGEDHVRFGRLPGQTLHDLGADGVPGWRALAASWPAFAGAAAPVGAHDAAREAATLATWVEHTARFDALPGRQRELARAASAVADALTGGRPDAEALLHRDLHDKQVLWDAPTGTLGLLDLDTAARGEAALDLANLDAHLDLRVLQGVLSPTLAGAARRELEPVADAVGATAPRLRAYGRSARLRLACVYAFRPSARDWLPAWVDAALG